MYTSYSQRASMAIIALVGCVALWALVIAFSNMTREMSELEREVTGIKSQLNPVGASNIQRYTNETNAFSFDYPLGWYVKDSLKTGGVLSLSTDSAFATKAPIKISVVTASSAKSLMKTMEKEKAVSQETTTVAATDSTHVMYATNQAYFVLLSNKKTLVIAIMGNTNPVNTQDAAIQTLLHTLSITK